MKNITKVLLSIFASAVLTVSAYAGSVDVTGSAVASYRVDSSDSASAANDNGKGLGISNELTFSASGELDNGMSWSYATELDSGAETTSGAGIDDTQIKVTSDFGTIGIMVSEGSLRSAAYGWDVTANGAGSDNGAGGSGLWGTELSGWNNIQYHLPDGVLPLGGKFKIGQSVQADTSINSKNAGGAGRTLGITDGTSSTDPSFVTDKVTQMYAEITPIEGLTLGADYMEVGGMPKDAEQEPEEGHWFAKYAIGAVSIGYGKGYLAHGISNNAGDKIENTLNTSMGIGFAVNDQLTISFSDEKSTREFATSATAEVELGVESIQAAYTMGGLTLSVWMDDIENTGYTADKDEKEFTVNAAFAF